MPPFSHLAKCHRSLLLLLAAFAAFAAHAWSSSPQAPASPSSAPQSSMTDLSPAQQARFDAARQAFAAQHWTEALPQLQQLHQDLPQNATITKYLAETEINDAQPTTALELLSPILQQSPDDPQALVLAAHAYAQAQQGPARDSMLAHLQRLHDAHSLTLQQFLLEREPLPNQRSVLFFYFLEPWSRYHITLMARIYNAAGQQLERLTLESGDFDQPAFAKAHPAEAARGERAYSMDGYVDQPTANGSVTQTHTTYAFFAGKPSYDTFRERALAVAEGKLAPMSSTSGIQVNSKP